MDPLEDKFNQMKPEWYLRWSDPPSVGYEFKKGFALAQDLAPILTNFVPDPHKEENIAYVKNNFDSDWDKNNMGSSPHFCT